MMDVWDIIIFGSWMPSSTGIEIISFLVGIIVLPLGLSFMVMSTYPAMVYDELTFVLMRLLKQQNFMYVRLGIEGFAIILATLFGLLAGIGFGSVNLGTVVISVTIGPLINIFLKHMNYTRT